MPAIYNIGGVIYFSTCYNNPVATITDIDQGIDGFTYYGTIVRFTSYIENLSTLMDIHHYEYFPTYSAFIDAYPELII